MNEPGLTHIVTRSGFECDINEAALNDAELLDAIVEFDGGNPLAYRGIMEKLTGAAVKKALYDHCRSEDGRVPWEKLGEELTDIISGLNSKKK